jgi:hypothetical protein
MLRQIDRRILVAGYIYLVVFFVSNGVLMSTISLYVGRRWGTDISLGGVVIGVSSLAGVMLALRTLLGIPGGPVAGVLSDRLGDRWPMVRVAILAGVTGFAALALRIQDWLRRSGVRDQQLIELGCRLRSTDHDITAAVAGRRSQELARHQECYAGRRR